MKKILVLLLCATSLTACIPDNDSDRLAAIAQKKSLAEATAQVGMPAITNFQEKRMLKQIYELRDQTLSTQAYIVNSYRGCLVYLGQAVGYGIPYSAQYSSPHKPWAVQGYEHGDDQAEPNGLFMPSSAQGTWVGLLNPETKKVEVVYIEPEVVVSPFRLTTQECK